MKLGINKYKHASQFDFLAYTHMRLLNRFSHYNNDIIPKIPKNKIFQYFSQLFRFDRNTSKKVLLLLEKEGYITICKGAGNGSFNFVILRKYRVVQNGI